MRNANPRGSVITDANGSLASFLQQKEQTPTPKSDLDLPSAKGMLPPKDSFKDMMGVVPGGATAAFVPVDADGNMAGVGDYVCEKFSAPIGTAVISVAFNASGTLLAAGGANGKSDVFSMATGDRVGHFIATAGVNAALLLEQKDACVLCVGNFAGRIQLFAKMRRAGALWGAPTSSRPLSEYRVFKGGAVNCCALRSI